MTEDTSLREKALRDEIPEDLMRLAREALAQEYVNEYPSYADLALRGTGSFTLCSIHAVARSIMSAREAKDRRIEALETENERYRQALSKIEKAPAWGYPERWETTPAEVRQLAREALGVPK